MAAELTEERIEHLSEVLRQVPLFSQLRPLDVRALVKIAQIEVYPPGAEIYRQSGVDNAMHVILSGQVALYHVDAVGVESFVGFRGPGPDGWLGEASVLFGEPHDVTVLAYTETTLLELERKALRQLMDADAGLRGRLTPKPENADKLHAPRFGWQADDESVVKFVREHAWALYRRMVILLGVLIVLAVITYVISGLFPSSFLPTLALMLAGVILLAIGFYVFIDWHDDFYVVTNKRVVHVDQIPGIRERREEAPLSAVQEIQFARNSILAHLLNFGDLRVETFGGSVAMKDIPQPEEVKSLIFREIERVRSRARAAARKAIRDELERRVGQEEKPAPPPPGPPPQEIPQLATLGSVLTGVFRYFFPKLRVEVGDSVTYRKHWIALLRKSRLPFAGLLFTMMATLIWWNGGFLLGLLPDSFWLVWLVLLLAFAAWSLWIFEDWRNDLYIVTSTRLIDIQRIPFLLQETRKEAGLDRVQTLEVSIPSPWARLFRFGHVIVRVPGSAFQFSDMSNPNAVQAEISKRIDQFKRRQAENEARGRRTELSDWFAVYDQIRTGYKPPVNIPESGEQKTDGRS